MDSLAHTLLGVSLARAGLAKRFGRGTTLCLALTSNLPDIDIFQALGGGIDSFLFRRMLTHSVFGVPLLAMIVATIFRWRYKNVSWKTFFGLSLLGMTGHLFFDLLNSYGIVLFYPLSLKRFELGTVFIFDFAIWAILLTPIVLSGIKRFSLNPERLSQLSLVVLMSYLIFCGAMRLETGNLLIKTVGQQRFEPKSPYVFPEALGSHRFRGVIRLGNKYSFYLIHALKGKTELKGEFLSEEDHPLIQAARQTERAQRLEWFFKAPVWRVDPQTNEVEVFDLRFLSTTLSWSKKPPFAIRFKVRE